MTFAQVCCWSKIRWAALAALWCLASGISGVAVAQAQEAKPNDVPPAKDEEKTIPQPVAPPREWPKHVDIQFSKGLDADPDLRFFGPDSAALAKVEPQGLRLTLPLGRDGVGDVGVEARKILRGDFEITLAYELLALPKPGPPGGAGAVLEARFDTPDSPKVRFGRTQKPNSAHFGSTFYILGENGKNTAHPLKYPRADENIRTGRMRFARTGVDLAFQVDEGGTGFRTIATKEVGGADVMSVSAFATTGQKPLLVDLRFTDLALRWDPNTKIPAEPGANPPVEEQRPRERGSRGWLVAAAIIGTLLVLSIAALLFLVRRRPETDDAKEPRSPQADAQV